MLHRTWPRLPARVVPERLRVLSHLLLFFSSRRRHTRYWRDWSSDVCSSDLHLGDGAALVVGDPGIRAGRMQDDRRAGLVRRPDGDPAHPALPDVVADLEAEGVADRKSVV